jgi:D-galactose 1-dehydrogenase
VTPIRIALVGIGKIAVDQHIPALKCDGQFHLSAAVSRHAPDLEVPCYRSISDLIASGVQVDALSLCTPPQGRYDLAAEALTAGYHVMLEKPPGATVSEVEALMALLRKAVSPCSQRGTP